MRINHRTGVVIPISSVHLGAEVEKSVLEVLRSGHLAQGPAVERFEAEVAAMAGTKHAMAVTSGTTALVAALESLELEPGDEVITSPFTFVATLNAILEAGAIARFADISDDFTIDTSAVEAAITPSTRVVMPVHLYGLPADMSSIDPVASRHELAIVEDAAQAHGAALGDRPVGSYGLGCFSFYATKNVTTGEGGVITTDDEALADRIRLLRNQGMRLRYQYEVPGHNYRMTDLQAAVALPQLQHLEQITAVRRRNAARLTEGLNGVPGLVVPAESRGRRHVFHQYTVRVTGNALVDRDTLAKELEGRGIGSGVYYPRPVYDYECYRQHPQVVIDETPNAERVAREVLSLPVHPQVSDTDIDMIISSIREVLDHVSR